MKACNSLEISHVDGRGQGLFRGETLAEKGKRAVPRVPTLMFCDKRALSFVLFVVAILATLYVLPR